jgi:hypothetical protein
MRLKSFLFSVAFSILGVVMISTGCNRDGVTPSGMTIPTATNTPTPALTPNPTAAPSSTPITWPGQTINATVPFKNVTIGSYIVETNYWNQSQCGTNQSVNINSVTGAFNVYQGPNCSSSNNVASYPNIFYGNEEGTTSPGSVLPKMVSTLQSVTSSWNFTPGGNPPPTDSWDIAYDIWLGPTSNCTSGFPCGGTELMIWVDYQGLSGYQTAVGGPLSVSGSKWQLWKAVGGGGSNTWTYLSYLTQTPSAVPLTDLNILTFIQDAVSKGFVQPSWYLYSIPAGIEIRQGGIPFTSNSFSVQVQ